MISTTARPLPGAPPAIRRTPQPASRLLARLEQLRRTLRPTPHVPLAVEGMSLFAKLEYTNPVGSIKDRSAYWILKRAAERGEICDDTTIVESSSGNFASALAAFTRLIGIKFIPVIDPNVSPTYESFLRRLCPRVVKVQERDDTGGFLKTRLQMVRHLCATVPNAYWTNQYGNLDALEAHYQLTAGEVCEEYGVPPERVHPVLLGVDCARFHPAAPASVAAGVNRWKRRISSRSAAIVRTRNAIHHGTTRGMPPPAHQAIPAAARQTPPASSTANGVATPAPFCEAE